MATATNGVEGAGGAEVLWRMAPRHGRVTVKRRESQAPGLG